MRKRANGNGVNSWKLRGNNPNTYHKRPNERKTKIFSQPRRGTRGNCSDSNEAGIIITVGRKKCKPIKNDNETIMRIAHF